MRQYLKSIRNQQGLSQAELSEKIGISQNYYSLIENGERQQNMSLALLQKFADAFGIPLTELIAAENQYKQSTDKEETA